MNGYALSLYTYGIYALKMVLAIMVFTRLFRRREHFVWLNIISFSLLAVLLLGISFVPYLLENTAIEYFGYMEITLAVAAIVAACFDARPIDYVFHIVSASFLAAAASSLRQVVVDAAGAMLGVAVNLESGSVDDIALTLGTTLVIYTLVFWTISKRMGESAETHLGWGYLVFVGTATTIATLLSLIVNMVPSNSWSHLLLGVSLMLFFVMTLYVQYTIFIKQQAELEKIKSEAEKETIRLMSVETYKQYYKLKESMDVINIKVHDMKHQLAALRHGGSIDPGHLKEVENAIAIYDSTVKTGSEALDVVLTEKSLVCSAKKIRLSIVADGEQLGFISVADIYSLFGNIMDNAIEYTETVPEEKRFVRLTVKTVRRMLVVHEENWFEGELRMENGFPVTHKEDSLSHGYGVKSISFIAEKYGGYTDIKTADGLFSIDVVIPIDE